MQGRRGARRQFTQTYTGSGELPKAEEHWGIAAGLLEIMYLELSEYVYLSSSGVGHPSGALVARFSPCVDQLAYFTRTVLAYLGYFSITHLHACRLCN